MFNKCSASKPTQNSQDEQSSEVHSPKTPDPSLWGWQTEQRRGPKEEEDDPRAPQRVERDKIQTRV